MILCSLLSLITTDSITTGVLACYVVVLSCLLCCYETHLKQVSKVIALNFGFLFGAKSRAIFMIFVGSLLFSFSLLGKLVGLAMVANAFLNIFVLIKHPSFEDAQRESAQKDIADFLKSHPGLANQALSLGVQAGTQIARDNPGIYFSFCFSNMFITTTNAIRPGSRRGADSPPQLSLRTLVVSKQRQSICIFISGSVMRREYYCFIIKLSHHHSYKSKQASMR
jgi:hypothetical protein